MGRRLRPGHGRASVSRSVGVCLLPRRFEPSPADWLVDDLDFMFTTTVIKRKKPPIREMVWRKGKRPVTLLELVGAFEEAKEEARIQRILTQKRKELIERNKTLRRQMLRDKVHKEDLNELGDRIKLYQQLPGAEENVEEGALTEFYRLAREIRALEARKASQALQGKTQIDDPKRGLDSGSRGTAGERVKG